MEFREFVQEVSEDLRQILGSDYTVHAGRIMKHNRRAYDTLTILKTGENAAPTVYLDQYYEQYRRGSTVSEISHQILAYHQEHQTVSHIEVDHINSFDSVKDRIICRLLNRKKNAFLLPHVPHREFLDLVLVYHISMDIEGLGKGSCCIANDQMKKWNITEADLYDAMTENVQRHMDYQIMTVSEVVESMTGQKGLCVEDDTPVMYVLTNEARWYGAFLIAVPYALRQAAQRLQDDFYILPSSVHECMILPVHSDDVPDADRLREMVCEANRSVVTEEELLSDHVYQYCMADGSVQIAAGNAMEE